MPHLTHRDIPNPLPSPYFVYWEVDGEVEPVEVLEYGFADPGCTRKTFLIKGEASGGSYRASVSIFFATPEDALADYQDRLVAEAEELDASIKQALDALANLSRLKHWPGHNFYAAGMENVLRAHNQALSTMNLKLLDKLHQMKGLIDNLAITPADDFYKTGDYMAGKVNDAWIESNKIMDF